MRNLTPEGWARWYELGFSDFQEGNDPRFGNENGWETGSFDSEIAEAYQQGWADAYRGA